MLRPVIDMSADRGASSGGQRNTRLVLVMVC